MPSSHILHGDCIEVLKNLEPNSVDSIVTDPPYGWRFMGKAWDVFDISQQAERDTEGQKWTIRPNGKPRSPRKKTSESAGTYDFSCQANQAFQSWTEEWAREAFRVLKPGGHMLVFCGPRTYHRMASGVEDAGFEVRDQLQWLFGSGFPKSLDISKAIDKAAGAEREVVGRKPGDRYKYEFNSDFNPEQAKSRLGSGDAGVLTAPSTPEAKEWQGFGTALKPAWEGVLVARKTLPIADECHTLALELCQLELFVNAARKYFLLNPKELIGDANIAQWLAGENTLTPEDLFALMATLQSVAARTSNWSIELSWLLILAEVLAAVNTSTTEMVSSLITELRILKCSLLSSTLAPMDQRDGLGENANASPVEKVFSDLAQKLDCIRILSAPGTAIKKDGSCNLNPNNEPILLARKPLSEKTVAANVLKWGTGGLNIDGTRIGYTSEKDAKEGRSERKTVSKGQFAGMKKESDEYDRSDRSQIRGRFPSNLLLSHNPDCVEVGVKKVKAIKGGRTVKRSGKYVEGKVSAPGEWTNEDPGYGDPDGTETVPAWECSEGCAVAMLDKQSGVSKSTGGKPKHSHTWKGFSGKQESGNLGGLGDTGGASRFFYVAKSSKRDRSSNGIVNNIHPTCKPTKLMRYLIRLITPPGGTVLDPFAGSGSTGVAALQEGFRFIGIEKEEEYLEIAEARMEAVCLKE